MGVVTESYERRWGPVVEGTLEMLADPADKVTYGVTVGRVWFECMGQFVDENGEQVEVDEEDSHGHDVASLIVVWSLEKADGYYYTSVLHLPIELHPMTAADLQTALGKSWEQMLFSRQADSMADLDAEMDEIFEGEPGL